MEAVQEPDLHQINGTEPTLNAAARSASRPGWAGSASDSEPGSPAPDELPVEKQNPADQPSPVVPGSSSVLPSPLVDMGENVLSRSIAISNICQSIFVTNVNLKFQIYTHLKILSENIINSLQKTIQMDLFTVCLCLSKVEMDLLMKTAL